MQPTTKTMETTFFLYTLVFTTGCLFFDWIFIHFAPKRCKKSYHGSPLHSYYLSIYVYQPLLICMVLANVPLCQMAGAVCAYCIRDFPNIVGQWDLYFHHFCMIAFTATAAMTPEWPHALFFTTGVFLECGSWTKNVAILMIGTRHFRLVANVNQAVMAVSHMVGLYLCYTLYCSEVSAFFKVTLPLGLIPTMVVRQYYSYKLE